MWGKMNNMKFKYTESENKLENMALFYTGKLIKSDIDKMNGKLSDDVNQIIKGGCTYLPNFFCQSNDYSIFNKLKKEIESEQYKMINWSKHFKHENPEISSTFNEIVKKMGEHFKVEILQTRLNYYKDGSDWKCLHKDRHAYGSGKEKIREDFTIGASFGASRELEFVHDETGNKFNFPQNNGDVFAFDSNINKKFMHGVPKNWSVKEPRFSIIAWGKQLN